MIVRSSLALALVAFAAWHLMSGDAPAGARRDRAPAAERAASATPPPLPSLDAEAEDAAERSRRSTYRLTYQVESQIEGKPGPRVDLTGEWTVEPLSDDRVAVRLARVEIDGHRLAPTAEAAERDVELLVVDGVVEGIAYAPKTDLPARRLLSGLATLLWPVVRADDAEWSVEQEEVGGAHLATYARIGDARIERRIERVLALRGSDGLDRHGGQQVTPTGVSTFDFDAQGLVAARIVDDRTFEMQGQTLTVVTRTRASLQRIATEVVTRRAPTPYPMAGFSAEVDFAAQAAIRDDQKVGGADLPTLMKDLEAALARDPAHPDTSKWRHRALERLTALIRIDPAVAPQVAALLARLDAHDPRAAFLAGALSGANTPDATNALAGVLAEDLPNRIRHGVHVNLSLTDAPTAESMQALKGELVGARANSAAMALGAQAGKLEPDDAAAESAIELLLRRYREAGSVAEKIAALKALGNSGHPAILAVVGEALADPALTAQAIRALRFVPGAEVDALLAAQLDRGAHAWAVIEAIAQRAPAEWAPRLSAARERFAGDARVLAQIDQLLAQWG